MIDMLQATLYRFKLNEPSYYTDSLGENPAPIDTLDPNYTHTKRFGYHRLYKLNRSMVTTANGYVPHITIRVSHNRRYPYWVTIHWSPNKVVFGHNFYELADHQFNEMISATVETLRECGITIHPLDLSTCQHLGRIDYGSNVSVTHLPVNDIIKSFGYLEKNTRSKKDTEIYDKEIKGSHVAFYNKSQYLIFYNKTAEMLRILEQPEKLDTATYQFALALRAHLLIYPLEILRIEHRLLNQTAIKRELEPLIGHLYPFTIQEVYQSDIRVHILRKHTDQVIGKGSLKTFTFGELDKVVIKRDTELALRKLGRRRLNVLWDSYATVFRTYGEKAALELITEGLPKTTAERNLKLWKQMIETVRQTHSLIDVQNEIYKRMNYPQSNVVVPESLGLHADVA